MKLLSFLVVSCTACPVIILNVSCASGDFLHDIKVVEANDENIFYSPYNWYRHIDNNTGEFLATTYPAGAYIKTIFTGTTIGIDAFCSSPVSDVYLHCYIDHNCDSWAPAVPAIERIVKGQKEQNIIFVNDLSNEEHTAEIYVSKTPEWTSPDGDRWNWPNALNIKGLLIDKNGRLESNTYGTRKKAIIYGDSITEAVSAWAEDQSLAIILQKADYEYGQIGWGYQTWYTNRGKHAPQFYTESGKDSMGQDVSWNHYCNQISRMEGENPDKYIDGNPDVIFNNLGVNDRDVDDIKTTTNIYNEWLKAEFKREEEQRPDSGLDTEIFMVMPFRFGRDWGDDQEKMGEWRNAFTGIYEDNRDNHSNLFLMDLGKHADYIISYASPDDLHPSSAGYFMLATYMMLTALDPEPVDVDAKSTTSGTIDVEWISNHENPMTDVKTIDTGYTVWYKASGATEWGQISLDSSKSKYQIEELPADQYDVKVTADNDIYDAHADSITVSVSVT